MRCYLNGGAWTLTAAFTENREREARRPPPDRSSARYLPPHRGAPGDRQAGSPLPRCRLPAGPVEGRGGFQRGRYAEHPSPHRASDGGDRPGGVGDDRGARQCSAGSIEGKGREAWKGGAADPKLTLTRVASPPLTGAAGNEQGDTVRAIDRHGIMFIFLTFYLPKTTSEDVKPPL